MMAAMTAPTPTRRRSGALWLLAAAMLLVALPPLCQHAIERHGRSAVAAYRYVSQYPGDDDDCPPDDDDCRYWRGVQDDGRTVHVLRLPHIPGTPLTWAIVVVGGGCCVTAFLSQSREKVERKKAECREPEWERR
jgi:hypothetical protein